jgi:hypothetical protein
MVILSFTVIKISSTCHLYLQFYMSAIYIVICQDSSSLWILTIYSFTCNTSIRVKVEVMTDGQLVSLSWCQAPSEAQDQISIIVRQWWACWCGAPSLMRGWVSCLQLLLAFASTVILRSVLQDSWPYFTVSDSRLPQPGGPGLHIYIPQEQVGPVCTTGHWVPFLSPPTTRRAKVEVFEFTSRWEFGPNWLFS